MDQESTSSRTYSDTFSSTTSTSTSLSEEKKNVTKPKWLKWEEYAMVCIESKFWPWKVCQKFYDFRIKYIKSHLQTPLKHLKQLSIERLLPKEMVQAFLSMKATISPHTPERTLSSHKSGNKKKPQYQVVVNPSIPPLGAGHFGFVFPYLHYQKQSTESHPNRKTYLKTVLKLQRWENVHETLDSHSFLVEILIGIIIQSRGLHATARIVDVVRTKQVGDVGVVFEYLPTNMAYFFLKGIGSKNYLAGLKVLMDLTEKVYQLQKCFHFRHRDFRMKNVMLTCSPHNFPTESSVRIIDLGKASIQFQKREYSAYYGFVYLNVRTDFDLAFFLADMLINFHQESAQDQIEMYAPLLDPLLHGVQYRSLLVSRKKNHLSQLMDKVHTRNQKYHHLCEPPFVYQTLQAEFERVSNPKQQLSVNSDSFSS